jgi:hypothetical protein
MLRLGRRRGGLRRRIGYDAWIVGYMNDFICMSLRKDVICDSIPSAFRPILFTPKTVLCF